MKGIVAFIIILVNIFKKKYIINHNSKEIHRIEFLKRNCQVQGMTNFEKAYTKKTKYYLKHGYNGCKWCYPETNLD